MQPAQPQTILVGIDVGGTFTDFVVVEDGALRVHKAPTTPDDQSRAIVSGLADLGIHQAEIVHGMTVATNALLERRGAKTALLVTRGFGDTLVIGRQNRPFLYRLAQTRPRPLVADAWRLEVDERMDCNGQVLRPIDNEEIDRYAAQLAADEIESVAIVFLFSFRNPHHEQQTAARLRARYPDLPLSLSSEILPEYREYERMSTTVINAYVQPLVATYLQRLAAALPGSSVRIMQSNGGAIGLDQAGNQAARVVLSGPAGGVAGAFSVAQQGLGDPAPQVITLDMGGTSTDVALCPGQIPTTSESAITDLPLRLPVIDIHTVGAGGGSVAYLDKAGGLHVGPRSAGALPGPVAYGQGGTEPTVTDANLVLGRLDAGAFLGGQGEVQLDEAAARRALSALGEKIDRSPEAAAWGVIRIANATMERALRRVSIERGHDPRRFVLLPFGGAGPLHACDLAQSLDIRRILVPPFPGVLSAYGMLVADIVHDASQSLLIDAHQLQLEWTSLAEMYDELSRRVLPVLEREGIDRPMLTAEIDVRYRGQSYELAVPLALPIQRESISQALGVFHETHARRYGYARTEEPVEAVNLRVKGVGPGLRPKLPLARTDHAHAYLGDKPVWFSTGGPTTTACYRRDRLAAGREITGPAIFYQFDTTLVVAPGWRARVDAYNNIHLESTT